MSRTSILGAAYELGEHETGHREAPGFAAKLDRYEMIDDAAIWGWGRFYRSGRGRAGLAVASARRTLARAGRTGGDIDAVLLCATEFEPDVDSHARYSREVLGELGIERAFVAGMTLGRCNTLLSAVHVADRLVASGSYHDVLVVAGDLITDEDRRFQQFALFSDAAASAVVTASPGELAIVASSSAMDVAGLEAAGRFSGRLGRETADAITRASGVAPGEVSVVLSPNVFRPLVRMSEGQSGFRPHQLYLDNIADRGHCFSADPLVNLVDLRESGRTRPGDHVLLTSSVPGSCVRVLTEVLDFHCDDRGVHHA